MRSFIASILSGDSASMGFGIAHYQAPFSFFFGCFHPFTSLLFFSSSIPGNDLHALNPFA